MLLVSLIGYIDRNTLALLRHIIEGYCAAAQ
jgi:hypothetical protein